MNRNSKIITGVILILIGVFWALNSFGITVMTWNSLAHAIDALWPLVFVVGGLNIIIDSPTINTILWAVLVGFVFALTIYYTNYGYGMNFGEDIYNFFFH